MIEYFESIDRGLVLLVNSWNTPFLDEFMWWISARITWVPLYVLLAYLAYVKTNLKTVFLFIALVGLTIIVADAFSVYGFKNTVQRYRPSHNTLIQDSLHYYQTSKNDVYRGGQFGFVSSHATNFFVITSLFTLIFFKQYPKVAYSLIFISILVCYSRMYLGVHYLTDLLGGAILGSFCSYLSFTFIWKKLKILI